MVSALTIRCHIHEAELRHRLLLQDRQEEALENLRKYRRGRYTEEEIKEEFHTQQTFIQTNAEKASLLELFNGTNLTRTLVVIGVNCCTQLGGQSFASKYSTIFVSNIGAVDPFQITMISSACNIVVVVLSMYLVDKVGRK